MKSSKIFSILLLVLLVGTSGWALAADTVTQTVTFEVLPINEIDVSGNPAALTVNSLDPVTDNTTTYDITTNETNKKITGAIDVDMPANTTLQVNLAAPAGATSVGDVTLSTVAADLVTGISHVNQAGNTITYTFSATEAADVTMGPQTRTVTFTIVDGV